MCDSVCSSRGHLAVFNICYNMERVPLAPSWWRVGMLQKAEQFPQLSRPNYPVLTSRRADTETKTHEGHTVEYDLWGTSSLSPY